jgi:hypothetical protein
MTNRRADTARSSSHEGHSAAQLAAGPLPEGVLLFGVQGGHDGLPPGRSAPVAAVDRGGVPRDRRDARDASMPAPASYPMAMMPSSANKNIDLIDKIFFRS